MTRLLVAGTDQVQLPPDSTGRRAGFVKSAIGSAGSEIYLPTSCLVDDAGNTLDSANAALAIAGTERGLVTRAAGVAFCKVSDGTNTAAVKAASTQAAGTDPALVVAISPNGGGIVQSNQGTPIAAASAWMTKTTDGTNVAAVKAASTAPAATDPALVVAVSPNTPTLPVSLASVPTHPVTNAGTFPIQDSQKVADNAAFTDGTTPVQPMGMVFDEVAGTALTENDIGTPRMDAKRSTIATIEGLTRGTRAEVKAASTAAAAADPSLVVAVSPNSPADISDRAARLLGVVDKGKVWDGTNIAAVKAASTAAVAADPALVVALSPNNNSIANALYVRPRPQVAYAVNYRGISSTAGDLAGTFTPVANTDKQLATLHHLATSTKTIRIRYVSITMIISGGTTHFSFDLRYLSATTAPATGNPAITPAKYESGDAAAEAVALMAPGTQGSYLATDSSLSPLIFWNAVVTAASADPRIAGQECVLYDARSNRDAKPITILAGVGGGIAITGRGSTTVAVNYTAFIEFTEE